MEQILPKNIFQENSLVKKINAPSSVVLIYGAGGGGSVMLRLLGKHSIKPLAFLDIQAERIKTKDNIPVHHPASLSLTDCLKKDAVVLLAITLRAKERAQIVDDLKGWGYSNIVDAQELNALTVDFSGEFAANPKDAWEQSMPRIFGALELMADDESIETFTACVLAHLSCDYSACPETDETSQYFLEKLPFSKGFSRFVDCGAYTGDTLEKLISRCGNIEAYAGFEPFLPVYEKLVLTAEKLSAKIKNCLLIPCAVDRKNAMLSLDDGTPGSSKVVENGSLKIAVVKIDDALKIFVPTFLKMDIEGAELDALSGARNTITGHRPDLAICVYHAINHYWDIPLLINSWKLGYKFYLRSHSSATMETVLYATV
jgi:FkbM family methyltransferase